LRFPDSAQGDWRPIAAPPFLLHKSKPHLCMFPDVDNAPRSAFIPNRVVVFRPPGEKQEIAEMVDFVKEMDSIDGKATAYVCTRRTCKLPTTDPVEMMKLLG
jgi:uncharacterized protein YyaL (SSP411 family)